MKELVAYIAQNLVNDPSEVRVKEKDRARSVIVELSVAPDDMGRVIGKGGRVANAMRTILRVAAMRQGKRATLNIVES